MHVAMEFLIGRVCRGFRERASGGRDGRERRRRRKKRDE